MEKVTILVIKYPCGDSYYHAYTLGWNEVPYLDSEEKKAEEERKIYEADDYYGEAPYFLDAIKIDGKIFMDIEGLLGAQSENKEK